MAIVKRGMHHLSKKDVLTKVCEEYWRQNKAQWKFYEFLFPEFKVIKRVVPPNNEDIACDMRAYTDDVEQAMGIWPERR